jgi:hypothetical protein
MTAAQFLPMLVALLVSVQTYVDAPLLSRFDRGTTERLRAESRSAQAAGPQDSVIRTVLRRAPPVEAPSSAAPSLAARGDSAAETMPAAEAIDVAEAPADPMPVLLAFSLPVEAVVASASPEPQANTPPRSAPRPAIVPPRPSPPTAPSRRRPPQVDPIIPPDILPPSPEGPAPEPVPRPPPVPVPLPAPGLLLAVGLAVGAVAATARRRKLSGC